MNFSERLKQIRLERGMSQEEIASLLGTSKQVISRYETNQRSPKIDVVNEYATKLNLPLDYLLGDDSAASNHYPGIPYNPTHRIPILGRISAGLPLYAEEHIEGYTYTNLNGNAEYFALRVEGDSMTASRIYDGDLLIVRRQSMVDNGDIAVVLVNGQDATVKKFYQNGNIVTLAPNSTNPNHQIQMHDIRKIEICVLGKVVKNEISF